MIKHEQNPMLRYLIVLTIASVVGLQTWMILFNNFAVEMAELNGRQVGAIQSVREIPGFLALLVVYVMLVMREHRLAALSIVLLGIGIAVTGLFPSYAGLLATTLLMSFGFHYYETVNQSLTLQYFGKSTFQKVADLRDIAPSMAMGFTINHIAAVVIPVLGGLIWMVDYRIPFVAGAVMSAISLIAVQKIPGTATLELQGAGK